MITYSRCKTFSELDQILILQKTNLPQALSEDEQQAEGFVTVHHDFDLLKAMNDACPHTIAKDGDKVVGYALSMHPKFGDEIEVLVPMFAEIEKAIADMEEYQNYVVMGQVCIDITYRKQGIFRKLYESMKEFLIPPYSCIITEVDHRNKRSLEAHRAIGFETLHTYHFGGRDWELIVLT
ncbi:GNAT family N-acetyltransferase [Aureisphaera galaxeae]|uniref:GNAT family N-acetyltransferase n=1 Tax=Aureisphaera galaxeae TaxID=1538023 RepID=UPI00234FC923|nr:GNAT family N-acetyltransferase [Aureisphaera galaxeae]MDC8002685.1 GNAT family N-acetyltransferase [Aureisphaera galaxeae]